MEKSCWAAYDAGNRWRNLPSAKSMQLLFSPLLADFNWIGGGSIGLIVLIVVVVIVLRR
jgi:hypothetical protein